MGLIIVSYTAVDQIFSIFWQLQMSHQGLPFKSDLL